MMRPRSLQGHRSLQGIAACKAIRMESCMIYTLGDRKLETVGADYYVAPSAQVIGSVILGRGATVWFNCVLRADSDRIIVGDGTNIQDGTIIHVDPGSPTHLGNNVTIGHGALVHSCFIDDGSLIANRAMILDRVRIGRDCLIAAGALIPPDKEIPDGSVVMGAPGKVVRQVTDRDLAMMRHASEHYIERGREYRQLLKAVSPDY
jgi:carbonic anhydrase/acetyltransferase-like protein (isoleucine patch superfamily)